MLVSQTIQHPAHLLFIMCMYCLHHREDIVRILSKADKMIALHRHTIVHYDITGAIHRNIGL